MAIVFGNIDRELADRQNVIKEDAARQYRGSQDMMESFSDLGDTISREVKEYKANQRDEQRIEYKLKRDEKSDKIRDETHNMNLMKTKLDANSLMRERNLQSYTLKKWPYGKEATKDRYESELQSWRDTDILDPLDKIYAFGSLYSEEALRAVQRHQTLKRNNGFKNDEQEKASLKKISRFQPVKIIEWATNNEFYDPADYGNPTEQADADATRIINTHMPGLVTDANEIVKKAKSGLTLTRYSGESGESRLVSDLQRAEGFTEPPPEADESQDGSQDQSQDGDGFTFSEILDNVRDNSGSGIKLPNDGDSEASETTDDGKYQGGGDAEWYDYLFRGRREALGIGEYEGQGNTPKLILDRDPYETTNEEALHNLRVLEGFSGGEVVDDNTRLIVAGSVDANGLVNKNPEKRDMLIEMLGITDPAKKKEWESYLMSDSVNSDYGYIKPGSGTGPRQDTRTSEHQRKRSLLKLNPDQVSKLQKWAYDKSLGEISSKHPHLKAGEKNNDSFNDIPYLKHILGDMGFRHGSSFMVKKEGDTGRYPKFGNAVKELTEAVSREDKLEAWNRMDKELFSTGIYSKGREGAPGRETKRFRFLRDRMDKLKNWINEGQYTGSGVITGLFGRRLN